MFCQSYRNWGGASGNALKKHTYIINYTNSVQLLLFWPNRQNNNISSIIIGAPYYTRVEIKCAEKDMLCVTDGNGVRTINVSGATATEASLRGMRLFLLGANTSITITIS